ncbi:MAG: threonine/serine dehydratase [Ectothiorhodospiraceae bacterium]|nr:threonine/serine dehydratase [Ectothiorhodospiraceae bacterium]
MEASDILAARTRIRDRIEVTPLVADLRLSDRLGQRVLYKCELFQHTGSFKIRGALNWLRTASALELNSGLGAVSAGNHAIALARAAADTGTPLTVVMPANASPLKVEASRALGADVILHGDINAAWNHMHTLCAQRGLTLVHPYDDLRIIAGQGTLGLEILEQSPSASCILCPVGGGGLISGLALVTRSRRPELRVIGVEPEGAPTLHHAWQSGGPKRLPRVDTCAWSLGAAIAGEHTYRLSRQWVSGLSQVSEGAIAEAMRHLIHTMRLLPEPGAAVGVASLLEHGVPDGVSPDGVIVVVLTGGNASLDELKPWLV